MTSPFIKWPDAIQRLSQAGEDYVIVTLIGRAGSAPRDPGSKMVVTAERSYDTIGGGELEFMLINKAREVLLTGKSEQYLEKIPLAAKAGQCCGGSVSVLLEAFCQTRPRLAVFGAGHVAQALMTLLSQLPIQVSWIDERSDNDMGVLEGVASSATQFGQNIHPQFGVDPVAALAELPAKTEVLILTHNHQLDFDLLCAALMRKDFSWLGCIGSHTKRERFFHRLEKEGFQPSDIEQIAMPVGHADVGGKLPMEVAVSIAAQLIQRHHQDRQAPLRQGLDWRELQDQLTQNSVQEPS